MSGVYADCHAAADRTNSAVAGVPGPDWLIVCTAARLDAPASGAAKISQAPLNRAGVHLSAWRASRPQLGIAVDPGTTRSTWHAPEAAPTCTRATLRPAPSNSLCAPDVIDCVVRVRPSNLLSVFQAVMTDR
jgi:hypothetical protein